MKNTIITILLLMTSFITFSQTDKVYPGKAKKPESNISSDFNYESKYINFKGAKVHYYESGSGDPVLFLHGIPTWSYLWRNVVSEVDGDKRAIALDFLGYGKSDLAKDDDHSFQNQYEMLKAFIQELNLANITLVVNDLGSAVGLKYAMEHENNVKGIVLIEAAYMTPEAWYDQLTGMQKMMFGMMRGEKSAERFLVKWNLGGKKMVPMFTKKKLSKDIKKMYAMPWEDEERRFVLVHGPGPHHIPKKMISQENGDFADVMSDYAEKLKQTELPILLIYAKKGLINRKQAIVYARKNFQNLSTHYLGKGKHFLPESHPQSIGLAINDWHANL